MLKDSSTKGSAALDFLSNHLNLENLTAVKASNGAGLYIGTQGDVCVLLSGDSDPVATGTATTNTANKLIDTGQDAALGFGKVQLRDIAVNTTDNGDFAAFVGVVDNATTLALTDVSNVSADKFPDGNETYEIYRAVILQNVAAGSFLPISVDRVFKLGTTASDIVAIY